MPDLDEQVLDDWCARETRYWSHLATGDRDFELAFERLNEISHSIFILDIAAGAVRIRPKPARTANMIEIGPQEYGRVQLYKTYIEECLQLHAPNLSATIAVDVHDISTEESDAPIFCFQKTVNSRNILLPDVDFMQHGWYANQFNEPTFAAKRSHGIFVGSSTGGGNLSSIDILEARSPRLQLSRALLGHEQITFSIAAAVQCDSVDTEALLKAQPYFSSPVSWEKQLESKFLLSIDGNGATCSRVVNSLRSQSILVKFASPNLLFYFHGLDPWRHYIPVDTSRDVERLLDEERHGKIDTDYILHEANAFFDRFLSRAAVHLYGAKLLQRYARDVAPKASRAEWMRRAEYGLIAGICVHVANIGDMHSGPEGWAGDTDRQRPIEGISINPAPGTDPSLLRYRCLSHDGRVAEWSQLGDYAGSRMRADPISGLEFELDESQAQARSLAGLIRFGNGAVQTVSPTGGIYREADGSAIIALKLWLS